MRDKLELKEIPPLGRSFAEYFQYFGLSELELAEERILDMGAGVSSFCAEMSERGHDVTAADPIYLLPAELIQKKFRAGLEEVIFQLPEVAHKYNWVFYRDIGDLKRHREKAYTSFRTTTIIILPGIYPHHYRKHSSKITSFPSPWFLISFSFLRIGLTMNSTSVAF